MQTFTQIHITDILLLPNDMAYILTMAGEWQIIMTATKIENNSDYRMRKNISMT